MTDEFRWYLGGLMATAREMAFMYAPFVNSYKRYQLGVVGADRDRVEPRQPHVRVSAPWASTAAFRVECRIPGADANPYLAFAATIAGRPVGHREQGRAARRCSRATRTRRSGFHGCRRACTRRSTCSARSKAAKEMFGDFVFGHLLNTAVQEQSIFDNLTVTDWELARYFERG